MNRAHPGSAEYPDRPRLNNLSDWTTWQGKRSFRHLIPTTCSCRLARNFQPLTAVIANRRAGRDGFCSSHICQDQLQNVFFVTRVAQTSGPAIRRKPSTALVKKQNWPKRNCERLGADGRSRTTGLRSGVTLQLRSLQQTRRAMNCRTRNFFF